jgi:hypothetical protein
MHHFLIVEMNRLRHEDLLREAKAYPTRAGRRGPRRARVVRHRRR